MLLFAESVTTTDLGMVVLSIFIILSIVEKVKALLWPNRTVQEEFVRQGELTSIKNDAKENFREMNSRFDDQDEFVRQVDISSFKEEVKQELRDLATQISGLVPRTEFTRVETQLVEISKEHKELREYTQARIHELTSKMHEIQLRIEVLHRDSQRDLERSTDKILTQIERLTDRKVDRPIVERPTILDAGGNLIKPH